MKADVCYWCNKPKTNRSRNKYCSRKCYWESKVGSDGYWTGKKRPGISRELHYRWSGGQKICQCGNKIASRSSKVKMCGECRNSWLSSRAGEKHHNWKNGKTPQNLLIRNSSKMKSWRAAVFERDNYTCRGCGKRGGYIEAHHIKGFAEYPGLRFVVDNGITYCQPCHATNDKYRAGGKV